MSRTWRDIWTQRALRGGDDDLLQRLLELDGFDTSLGGITPPAWRAYVDDIADRLNITAQSTVTEVGCGGGAFLYPLHQRGCAVGGIDYSQAMVDVARAVMPEGRFAAQDACDLHPAPKSDFVVSSGVFFYFPDQAYAAAVATRMLAAARTAIAILDVSDLARETEAHRLRRGHLSEAAYAERYKGLDHLYLDRDWLRDTLLRAGACTVEIEDQSIEGYGNAAYRFNAFAWLPPADDA